MNEREQHGPGGLSAGIQLLLAAACGLLIAGVYYAQPLTGPISHQLGMPPAAAGLIVTLPLTGYGIGLIAIVPLGDLLENRRLILVLVAAEALVLAAASMASSPIVYLPLAFLIGLNASALQVIMPMVTYFVPEEQRGRAVGRLVSGMMLGIMLARPVSSFVTDFSSWRMIFRLAAGAMFCLLVGLSLALPERQPKGTIRYPALLRSLGHIFGSTEILRRRAYYHAAMFGAFSVFWTSVALFLAGSPHRLSQSGIAWVALAGVAGAVAPPFAGRLADRGLSRVGTRAAMIVAMLAFGICLVGLNGGSLGLGAVAVAGVILDFAVSANLVFGQRAIYVLGEEQRSRLNGLYLATFFVGGAIGSALAGWCFAHFGWIGACALGALLPLVALLYSLTER